MSQRSSPCVVLEVSYRQVVTGGMHLQAQPTPKCRRVAFSRVWKRGSSGSFTVLAYCLRRLHVSVGAAGSAIVLFHRSATPDCLCFLKISL